jgi:hypothetical protein
MRVRLFRLEAPDGTGVFTSGLARQARDQVIRENGDTMFAGNKIPSPFRHPDPYEDVPGWSGADDQYAYYCAFGSIPCLLRWFDSEAIRIKMNNLGVEMVEFEVDEDDIFKGKFQWMFRKDRAALVDRHPVPTVS